MLILVALAVMIFLGVAGARPTEIGPWYRDFRKPRLNPPDWLFGPAWTIVLDLPPGLRFPRGTPQGCASPAISS